MSRDADLHWRITNGDISRASSLWYFLHELLVSANRTSDLTFDWRNFAAREYRPRLSIKLPRFLAFRMMHLVTQFMDPRSFRPCQRVSGNIMRYFQGHISWWLCTPTSLSLLDALIDGLCTRISSLVPSHTISWAKMLVFVCSPPLVNWNDYAS